LPEETRVSGTLKGRVAWVTGAGTGIGRAAAVALAEGGATVVLSGRRTEQLEEARRAIEAAGGAVSVETLDVAERTSVAAAGERILARHGRVDVLVNAAGFNVPKRHFRDLAGADFERVIATNLNGALHMTLAVLPAMRARRDGLVINIASWLGRWPGFLGGPAYAASKHAMASITHQLNIEEGVHGIRGCVIYPGEVATPILKTRPRPPSQAEMDRMLRPEDVGRTVRFVAESPATVCFNEIVVTPTLNRLVVGGEDLALAPERPA
jgi:NADP-dependent 3-hydroxy acid dehydrogenase YdfG